MTLFQRICVVAALVAFVVVIIAAPVALVAIVKFSLPLALGVAHNGGAALLLLAVVLSLFSLSYRRRDA